jgi:hypothetical protein
VVPNPSLPADDEIVGSTFQLVLVPDLFALDAPIVLGQVLQFLEKRITLLDSLEAREWETPGQMVNENMEASTNERYFLGSHTILFQSKNMTSRCIKYDEYAEYTEYTT